MKRQMSSAEKRGGEKFEIGARPITRCGGVLFYSQRGHTHIRGCALEYMNLKFQTSFQLTPGFFDFRVGKGGGGGGIVRSKGCSRVTFKGG